MNGPVGKSLPWKIERRENRKGKKKTNNGEAMLVSSSLSGGIFRQVASVCYLISSRTVASFEKPIIQVVIWLKTVVGLNPWASDHWSMV